MFTPSPFALNGLAIERSGPERARYFRRGLAQAASDDAQTQSYLQQFAAGWAQVKDNIQALLDLPAQLQQARADLDAVRQAAIDAGDPDTAQQAEVLFADVQAHEDQAAQVAAKIEQYRDTWNQIASYIEGTWGSAWASVEGWWSAAKRAVGLGALGILPLALPVVIAAVVALGLVVAALGILAWWQTTYMTIQGVKDKTLPPGGATKSWAQTISELAPALKWGAVAAVVLGGVMLLSPSGGSRRR
jgi:hypothetical protein